MFSPSSIHNPFQYQHQARKGNSSIDDPMPNSLQEVNLSSPFLIDGDDFLGEFLSEQQVLLGPNAEETQETCPAASSKATKLKEKRGSNSSDKRKPSPRKRTGKKDRHSKIYTAQGPRDRRMRLSLPIARKFFDLQDILGFDKASKTIEWLFKKSKTAIKEIKNGFPGGKSTNVGGKSVYCTSESEVVSGMKHTSTSSLDKEGLVGEGENSIPGTPKEKRNKGSHKPSFRPVAKESREMARARARERTREKMKSKGLDKTSQRSRANPSSLEPNRPITHLEDDEQLGLEDPGMNYPRQGVGVVEDISSHFLHDQMDSVSIIDKFWGASTRAPRSSSSADLSFSHSLLAPGEANILEHEFSGFLANRVINNDRIQHRYCVVPTFKLSTSNFDVENPNLISMTNPNPRDPNPTPVLMNTSSSQENDSSPINLMGFSNIFIDENPSSIPFTTTNTHTLHSNQIGSPFSYNPPPNNYGSFY